MKKVKLVLALFMVGAFLVGCAGPHAVLDESWTKKPSKVKIVFTEPFVSNVDDLEDDLPGYVDNFTGWFSAEVESYVAEMSNGINYSVNKISSSMVRSESAELDEENIKVPKLKSMDNDADVYLVMDDVWFGRTQKTTTCGGGMGMVSMCTISSLTCRFNYAYYLTKNGKRVGYGHIDKDISFTFAMTANDWLDVVGEAVKDMIDKTPLQDN